MIYEVNNKLPKIHKSCFITESSDIIGDVFIDEGSSVWFGSVLRGDICKISVGKFSNIQDNCVIHANSELTSVVIEDYVSIGHGALLHGCKVRSNSMVGMGSIVLDGAEIGEYTLVGAGSLVTSNTKIPSGVLCFGSPAKVIRELTEEEKQYLKKNSQMYAEKVREYLMKQNNK